MTITVKMTNRTTKAVETVEYYITREESTSDAMTTAECFAGNDYGDTHTDFAAIDPRENK